MFTEPIVHKLRIGFVRVFLLRRVPDDKRARLSMELSPFSEGISLRFRFLRLLRPTQCEAPVSN
jgi:hypothetical protein